MRKEDVKLVTEIDREAFPTNWPAPDYQRELKNRLAHHTVACYGEEPSEQPGDTFSPEKSRTGLTSMLKRLFVVDHTSGNGQSSSTGDYVTGFVGLWVLADEAHITSIAVRESHRRRGIGELLLIGVIDQAAELHANIVTLEVRVSNTGAQNLYTKYAFANMGVRKGYYTDNREDAFIMSTESITSEAFQAQFQQLKQAHAEKLGISLPEIGGQPMHPASRLSQPDRR
jgi:ribosomal-protein-alanine N-acetyltransferase